MLFSPKELKSKQPSPGYDQRSRRQIPTGVPRLMESSAERLARERVESWVELVAAIRRSAAAYLELLRGRDGGDPLPCPWERLVTCDRACRCGGSRTVTVSFLREHYTRLAIEIEKIARPAARRSS
jgi:hypothetical protein